MRSCTPFEALPFYAREAVTTVANRLNCDDELVALTYMGAASQMLLGTTCRVEEGYIVPCSLYTVVGAPPSSGKTPVVTLFKELIDDILKAHWLPTPEEVSNRASMQQILEAQKKGVISKAKRCASGKQQIALAEQLQEIDENLARNRAILPFEIGNTTIQALPKELSKRNGFGYIFDAEGGILSTLETVSPNQLRTLLRAWSMEPISDITKKNNISISRPFLTITCLWQTERVISVLLSPRYNNTGLTARLLPLIIDQNTNQPSVSVSDYEYHNAISAIKTSLERIFLVSRQHLSNIGYSPLFTMDPIDAAWGKKYRANLLTSRLGNTISEFSGKADLHAIRLAMVLSSLQLSKADQMISTDVLKTACNLTTFFAKQHVSVRKDADWYEMLAQAKQLLPYLEDLFYNQALRYIYTEDLAKPSGRSKKQCEKVLHWLEREGYLRIRRAYSPGKETQWETTHHLRALLSEELW